MAFLVPSSSTQSSSQYAFMDTGSYTSDRLTDHTSTSSSDRESSSDNESSSVGEIVRKRGCIDLWVQKEIEVFEKCITSKELTGSAWSETATEVSKVTEKCFGKGFFRSTDQCRNFFNTYYTPVTKKRFKSLSQIKQKRLDAEIMKPDFNTKRISVKMCKKYDIPAGFLKERIEQLRGSASSTADESPVASSKRKRKQIVGEVDKKTKTRKVSNLSVEHSSSTSHAEKSDPIAPRNCPFQFHPKEMEKLNKLVDRKNKSFHSRWTWEKIAKSVSKVTEVVYGEGYFRTILQCMQSLQRFSDRPSSLLSMSSQEIEPEDHPHPSSQTSVQPARIDLTEPLSGETDQTVSLEPALPTTSFEQPRVPERGNALKNFNQNPKPLPKTAHKPTPSILRERKAAGTKKTSLSSNHPHPTSLTPLQPTGFVLFDESSSQQNSLEFSERENPWDFLYNSMTPLPGSAGVDITSQGGLYSGYSSGLPSDASFDNLWDS